MNSKAILFTILSAFALFTQSCKKEEDGNKAITQNIDASITKNSTYTFTLPANTTNEAFKITTQASHFTISQQGVDASGAAIYQYQPSKDYVGTDNVTLASAEENHQGGNSGNHSGCQGHHDDDDNSVTINIHLTVTDVSTVGKQ